MKSIQSLLVASAVLGPAISFQSIYLFHFVALMFSVLVSAKLLSGGGIVFRNKIAIVSIFGLTFYCFLSLAWHPSVELWFKYNSYLMLGFICVLAVYHESNGVESLNRIFRVLVIFIVLGLLVGLFESLGLMRLPISRYSEYASYFGYPNKEFPDLDASFKPDWLWKPSGFNFNTNNFGFVLLVFSPFLVLSKRVLIKIVGFPVFFWLLYCVDSKAHYLAFLVMLLSYLFWYAKPAVRISLLFLAPVFLFYFLFVGSVDIYYSTLGRSFDSLFRGIDLVLSDGIQGSDSTSVRASIYAFGIQELMSTYGLGLGFGGIEALMIERGFDITTFHFLFLQLLVDLGVFVYFLFLLCYISLIVKLYRIFKDSPSHNISYFAGASSLGLIVAVPASIAPAATHYMLPFYLFLGFALTVVKVNKLTIAP